MEEYQDHADHQVDHLDHPEPDRLSRVSRQPASIGLCFRHEARTSRPTVPELHYVSLQKFFGPRLCAFIVPAG
jgi:hypothetical protein